jgi:predicted amidohydrolase
MSERRGDDVYNSLVLIEPDGIAGSYAKRVLVPWPSPLPDRQGQSEATIFTTGRQPGVFQWGALRAGTVVCADGSFAPFWNQMMPRRPEIVVWASSSLGIPPGGVEKTAQERGVPIVYVNRPRVMQVGDDEQQLGGRSRVVDGTGRIIGELGNEMDGILIVDLPVEPSSIAPPAPTPATPESPMAETPTARAPAP